MIEINKNFTASIDIDAQNSFTPLCPNELPVPGGDEIVDALNEQATYAKYRIGSKDAHNPKALWVATKDNPQFSKIEPSFPDMDIRWNSHCNVGSYGYQLLSGLPHPMDYDFFVWKGIEVDVHPYSAIYHDLGGKRSTGVIEWLRSRSITTVIISGLATEFCVKASAIDLKKAGFQVILSLSGCRGITGEGVAIAIEDMKYLDIIIVDNVKQLSVIN